MPRLNRRTMIAAIAGAAGVAATRAFAQEWREDESAATPDASPEAELGTGTGAVFMTIRNSGDAPDALIDGTTEVAQSTEVHESVTDGTSATMQHMEHGLEVPAGGEISLEPGGYHLMLVDLNQDLLPDSTFTLTLTFQAAGSVELTIPVVTEHLDDVPPVTVGAIEITGYWSRPAPRLSPSSGGTPVATPKG